MFRFLPSLFVTLAICLSTFASAEEVSIKPNNLRLNANLLLSEESGFSTVVLITHGTLAHNGMEIIDSWQSLLTDEGISSLAINLSLGQDNRHGMYDCSSRHTHKHTDAIEEIHHWIQWLKSKGSKQIILAGHSRGGNQSAWYLSEYQEPAIQALILLAPQTWDQQTEASAYKSRYQVELKPLLDNAAELSGDSVLSKVDFIYCEDAEVYLESFVSYYQPDSRLDTPTLLRSETTPTLVIAGSEDTTVPALEEKIHAINNKNVQVVEIEGADHFFRDLYMDEVIEHSIEFMDTLSSND
ncbi:alpha/beta hydrolase [uncultured Neptuniibacter sp.]|uniref:alpha/beta hydrolase n=1 Tax=uncultured Neptuniibacter sp. TaxID=502143 RepID=UPI00262E353E|nr:alpha/beta hydrolase [uncultured Neptuniibacter sp.]